MSDIEQTQSIEGLAVQLPEATAAASGHFDVRLGPVHSTGVVFIKFILTLCHPSRNVLQRMYWVLLQQTKVAPATTRCRKWQQQVD